MEPWDDEDPKRVIASRCAEAKTELVRYHREIDGHYKRIKKLEGIIEIYEKLLSVVQLLESK